MTATLVRQGTELGLSARLGTCNGFFCSFQAASVPGLFQNARLWDQKEPVSPMVRSFCLPESQKIYQALSWHFTNLK